MMLKLKFLLIALVVVCTQESLSQTKTITGLVTDDSGLPLPGVTVIVEGTTNGTTTDFDGNYSLANVQSTDRLTYSYIGMVAQTVQVGQRTVINIALLQSFEFLEEVVVVGYGVQKKTLTTGANLNIKGEDIAGLNTSTAMEALQGVAPGVSITRNNGQPGAGTKVTIRGLGTIDNSDPLYIVDGVAVGNIDYLSSSDIESIDVLKDAASAAIYGSRAANGVVLVTTHKGRKGSKARVTYETYYGFQKIYKNVSPLNAQEYMFIMDEGRVNDGLSPNDWQAMLTNNSWLNNSYPGNLGTKLGEDIWNRLQNGWEGTNWINEMSTKNAPISSHSINITGGGEDNVYAFGISYLDQKGILGGDLVDAGFERLTARMNTEHVLFKNEDHSLVTIGQNLTYTNNENRSVGTGNIYWNDLHNALVQNPLMPAYWADSPDQHGFTPTLDGLSTNQHNPLAVMYYRHKYSNLGNRGNTIVGNVYLELEPLKNLRLRTSYGVNSWFGHSRSWTPIYALGVMYSNSRDGVSQSQYMGADQTWTNTISYEHVFGDHKINALIGNEVIKNKLNNEVGGSKAGTRFGQPEYAFLNNADKSDIGSIDTWGANWAAGGGAIVSYIARAQYDYKEKYMLSATMRADGSSNFAKGNRWGYFPSVSAGWILTNEDFIGNQGVMDFAKLRGSWGQNGNQAIDNFIYSSNIAYRNPGYYFGDTKPTSGSTAVPARVTNPDVTWETSEQINVGLDTRFFNSRLAFTADWYVKTTKDWLVVAPIQGTAGAGPPFINGGDIENRGFELMLSWNDHGGDFKYGATLSGAFNKNKITKIDNAEGIIVGESHILAQGTAAVSRAEVGRPIGYFYGFQTDGILQNQDEVDAYVKPTDGTPYFPDQRPGDVRFVDRNQDGLIDEADKTMLGKPNPDFELGIQLNAEYKGFYVNSTLSGKFGMQVMQSYRSFSDNYDQNYTTEIFGRWHGEGTSNRLPRLSSVSNRNIQNISDIYMQDADFLRINNLTLGFKLGDYLTNIKYISQIKLYTSINNLYTFTKFEGMDPDVRFGSGDPAQYGWASGIDLGLYPLPRTWMFGMSVEF